jgi:dTDP-glucose pyrophosphorylase
MQSQENLKKEFAAQLLRDNGDGFKAAFAVCGDDSGMALQIARLWINDPFVVAEQKKLLLTSDAKTFLPTKEQQARDVYVLACDVKSDLKERLAAHRLYAEIMSHIEKPLVGQSVNVLNQGVMIVRDAGSNEDWERKALEQQRALTINATVN